MKSISAYRGYRGLYEVFPECLIVTVYRDGCVYEQSFGFTIKNTDEADIEYQFRLYVDSFVSKRPRIYSDLKMRHDIKNRIDTSVSPARA